MVNQERERQITRLPTSEDFSKEFKARPSLQARKEFASTFVYHGLHSMMDWTTVLVTLNFAYGIMEDPNPQVARIGNRVMNDIDSYLHAEGMVVKFVLPPLDNPRLASELASEEMRILRNRVSANSKLDKATPKAIHDLLLTITPEFVQGNPLAMHWRSVPFIVDREHQNDEHIKALTLYSEVLRSPNKDSEPRFPEDTLKLLKEATRYRDPRLPDPYRKKINGTSIAQLEHDDNSERFSYGAMKWIAGITTGDLTLLDTANGLFFADTNTIPPISQLEDNPQTPDDFSKKAFSFQWWLTQKVLLPLFDPRMLDRKFDRAFTQIIDNEHQDATLLLSSLIAKNFFLPLSKQWMRDGRFAITDSEGFPCPLQAEVLENVLESPFDLDMSQYSAVLYRALLSHSTQLAEGLIKRFGNTKQFERFIGAFDDAVTKNNPLVVNTEEMVNELHHITGGKTEEVLADINNRIEEIYESNSSYGVAEIPRAEDMELKFTFPEVLGMEKIGIENVSFIPTYNKDGHAFILRFSSGKAVGGIINNEEKLSIKNMNLTSHAQILKFVMKAVQFGYIAYQKEQSVKQGTEQKKESSEETVLYTKTDGESNQLVTRLSIDRSDSPEQEESVSEVDPNEILENLRKLLQEEAEKGGE